MKTLIFAFLLLFLMPIEGSTQQNLTNQQRGRIKQLLETDKIDGALWRAMVKIMLAEFNNHADKHNAILSAVDAATTLADLKTRVAAIPDYPQRTEAQLINSLKTELGVK